MESRNGAACLTYGAGFMGVLIAGLLKRDPLPAVGAIAFAAALALVIYVLERRFPGLRRPVPGDIALRIGRFTCYEMTTPAANAFFTEAQVEERARELQRLAVEGTLSDTAVQNAAEAIAVHAEYIACTEETQEMEGHKAGIEAWQKLDAAYANGELQAGEPAALAGERLGVRTIVWMSPRWVPEAIVGWQESRELDLRGRLK